ncbi:putative electron transfer flavoprotein FixA [Dehalobacter sp. DCM]|uniref:putative electron transfer flavoprotein FixA n=1 Tax=Dehalobacter sp. DCM TaxID=2907827 RepID=UPI00308174B3|nr:putative electron transfer flavoprotein FixA [Dehalobacter sp. DCM]
MNIIVCYKYAPDVEDIEIKADGSVSTEKARWILGEYDLRAVEAAVKLAEKTGGRVIALSVGPQQLNDAYAKKDVLSRGPVELYLVIDGRLTNADTHLTAKVLAAAIRKIGDFDLVLCGEGSSDLYFQQTGLQLGEILGVPTINAISGITLAEGCATCLTVQRHLEDEIEILDIPLPAALSVTSDIAMPRIPTMKETLKAAKKPVTEWNLHALGLAEDTKPRVCFLNTRSAGQMNFKDVIMFPILLMLEMKRSSKYAGRKQILIDGTPEKAAQTLINHLVKEDVL